MKVNQIKLGAILSYVAIFVNNIIGIFYTPFMISCMGQSEYGLYSLVATVVSYLTVLDLGFGNAIIIYASKYKVKNEKEKESKLYGMFITIYTIISLVCIILGLILYCNVEGMFGNTMNIAELQTAKVMMLILTVNLMVTFPFSVFTSIITVYEKFVFLKLANIIRAIAMPIVMLPLLLNGHKSISMAVVTTILNILLLLANMIYATKKLKINISFGKFDIPLLKEIAIYSFFVFLSIVIDKINWQLDPFIIGATISTAAVAIYNVAVQFNNIYMSFSNAISGVLLPKITTMIENRANDDEISDMFIKTGRLQYILLALIFTGFVLFGDVFIRLLYGTEYQSSYYIACILIGIGLIPSIENVGIKILQAKNKHKFRTIVYFIISILNIGISIVLIDKYGEIGAAIGTAISMFIGHILIMNIYYYKVAKINITKFIKQIARMTIPIIITFIIGTIIKSNITINGYIMLIGQILLYTGIYGLLMWKLGMNDYERELIKEPLQKILRKVRSNNES